MGYSGDYISDTNVSNWPSGTLDADKEAVIKKVEQIIDKVCHTHFGPEGFDIELNGNGKNRLFIPLQSNIISVSNVYISCIELDPCWYTWDANSIYLDPCVSGSSVGSWAELAYRLGEAAERGIFPRGYNNIRVVGTCGEAEVPEAIKQAAIILAESENDPTLYKYAGPFKSEKIGDYSYTKSDAEIEERLTGILEADRFLRHYVKRKPIIMAP